MAHFASDAHWLAACREDANARGRLHDGLGQTGDRADDVLAVVDNKQSLAIAQPCDEVGKGVGL